MGNVYMISIKLMFFINIVISKPAELVEVSTPALLCWFLIAEYFFYGTGHQPSFPTIHWDAAFVGTGGHFYGNLLPAVLIGIYNCNRFNTSANK